jgi:hypothetical protein
MRLTWRDVVATLFVAVAVVIYALWVTGTAMADTSTRVLAAVVFGLGWAACTTNQKELASVYGTDAHRRTAMAYVVFASLIGFVALVAGIVAIAGASEAILATLAGAMIALWAMSTVRHAIVREPRRIGGTIPGPLSRAA